VTQFKVTKRVWMYAPSWTLAFPQTAQSLWFATPFGLNGSSHIYGLTYVGRQWKQVSAETLLSAEIIECLDM